MRVNGLLLTMLLADGNAPVNVGPDFGKAGPLGLAVVLVLLVGTFLLIRSMNSHLRKLPETFDPEHPEADQAADEGTVGTRDTASTTDAETSADNRGQQDDGG